jgi:hypothetical protein
MVISWRSRASTSYSDDDASRCLRDFWSKRQIKIALERGTINELDQDIPGRARTTSCSMLFIEDSAGTRRMALNSNRAAQRFRHLATSPEAMMFSRLVLPWLFLYEWTITIDVSTRKLARQLWIHRKAGMKLVVLCVQNPKATTQRRTIKVLGRR